MPDPTLSIRPAVAADAAACAEVYSPYVTGTSISFEIAPPAPEQFMERMAEAQAAHEWLVAARDGLVVGYAYAHRFAERAAYRWSCETSIYVASEVRGQGVGRALYGALLERLAALGYRRAFAGVTLPNEASIGLHRDFGFRDAGCYDRVGWKHGAWHDVAWLQRDLQSTEVDPPQVISASR
jgi:L-amino acid N-acyltransferase YncA